MATGVLISRMKFFSPDRRADVTRILKLDVAGLIGVPAITPAVESDKPAGREPETTVQVRVDVPPFAWSVREYEVPTTPSLRGEFVVMVIP